MEYDLTFNNPVAGPPDFGLIDNLSFDFSFDAYPATPMPLTIDNDSLLQSLSSRGQAASTCTCGSASTVLPNEAPGDFRPAPMLDALADVSPGSLVNQCVSSSHNTLDDEQPHPYHCERTIAPQSDTDKEDSDHSQYFSPSKICVQDETNTRGGQHSASRSVTQNDTSKQPKRLPRRQVARPSSKWAYLSDEDDQQMRAGHNQVEKNYRYRLNRCFSKLLAAVEMSSTEDQGAEAGDKAPRNLSKGDVLTLARLKLLALGKENELLGKENELLRKEMELLKVQINPTP